MSKFIILDIETLPAQSPEVIDIVVSKIKAPGNYKKQEAIDAYIESAKESEVLKTSFSGLYGSICCIGYAVGDNPVKAIYLDKFTPDEKSLLTVFWATMLNEFGELDRPTWIGHNIVGFDLPFLFQRSVINGVKPTISMPVNPAPWDKDVFDTMTGFMGKNAKPGGSLDSIATVLGVGSKNGISGADVWPMFQDGKIKEIADYCKTDVELTREIYKKINFIDSVENTMSPFAA